MAEPLLTLAEMAARLRVSPRWLRDECVAAGVPFFFKQWGEFAPLDSVSDGPHDSLPDDDRKAVYRVGKKGRRPPPLRPRMVGVSSMKSFDWLPGDGSIAAIRAEFAANATKLAAGGSGHPNPYQHARVGALLAEYDRRVTELLAANNREVERRRDAEGRFAASPTCCGRWSLPVSQRGRRQSPPLPSPAAF